jgi:hypothetical protein
MNVLIFCLASFLAAFLLHLLVWFIRVPANPFLAMLVWFAAVWVGIAGLCAFLPGIPATWRPDGPWQWLAAALFHASGSLSYIILYSALEQDSPTITIVKFTDQAGPSGCAPDDYQQVITDDLIIHSRLRAMLDSQLARRHGDRLFLTRKGAFWDRLFGAWMKLLAIREGG